MRFMLLFLGLFWVNLNLSAQQIHRCYTDEYINHLEAKHPGTKSSMDALFKLAKNHIQTKNTQAVEDTIYRIPVVVHIVYNAAAENVSDNLVYSQIDVLNKDYRRQNADTNNTRAIFKARAADIGFQFHLATIDPDGNPTTGITRTQTTRTNFGGGLIPSPNTIDEVKKTSTGGKEAWDTDTYLNIWVCNTGGSILGIAYPPLVAPNWPANTVPNDSGLWGVVISHQVFGRNNPLATGQLSIANRGRTAVHEVGHFFGLRHIWGDAGNPFFNPIDCDITKDDGIDDTPHMGSNSQQTGCDFSKNTCTNGETPDEPDMPENYMDYSTEQCQNMFTKGQANLMRNMARIGRPNLGRVIIDENVVLNVGDYVVINGTDTIQITDTTILNLQADDQIMVLNFNDGFNYTVTESNNYLSGKDSLAIKDNGDISVIKGFSNITSLKNNEHFKVFPNPVKSILNIKSSLHFNKVTLQNTTGKTVLEEEFTTQKNQFSTSKLPNGIYFLSIYEQGKLLSINKVSIQN